MVTGVMIVVMVGDVGTVVKFVVMVVSSSWHAVTMFV